MVSLENCTKHLKKHSYQVCTKLIQKMERGRNFVILLLKGTHRTKEKIKHHKPLSLTHLHAEILTQIRADQF